jgi:AcrR family transcriptional regulator
LLRCYLPRSSRLHTFTNVCKEPRADSGSTWQEDQGEALATRERLLDAAQALFREHGVTRTSLAEVATAAGMTRGAVYWHFKDKADLFRAMCDRATLPLDAHFDQAVQSASAIRSARFATCRSAR